ncbi:hypothetical protein PR048_016511 [Dryococelus australis]|uniref:PiggyBac transposable element-derived protein domain-containing protein n=1 Tax=Dryococelus australis TaxID=614101 RepID=A0ABQ9HJX1_9NEOP|nr:hypothetical protein PR048_016511 [Dryococelus australis]
MFRPPEFRENVSNSSEATRLTRNEEYYSSGHDPEGSGLQLFFSGEAAFNPEVTRNLTEPLEFECHKLFVGDDLLDIFAAQQLRNTDISSTSRLKMWTPTNKDEITKFLRIIAFMGLVKAPSISDYWTTNPYFRIGTMSSTMSRNRFKLLLRMWHISDTEKQPKTIDSIRISSVKCPDIVQARRNRRGTLVGQQNDRGITVLKWAYKTDILILSTCHGAETVPLQRRNGNINKQKAIVVYNKGNASINL